MGESPDHGVVMIQQCRKLFPGVPFIFYSRKITPEDMVCVLKEGAVDAIRKGAFTDDEVRTRLAEALQKPKDQKKQPKHRNRSAKFPGLSLRRFAGRKMGFH